MKKIYKNTFLAIATTLISVGVMAQGPNTTREIAPGLNIQPNTGPGGGNQTNANFDIQFTFLPEDSVPTVSLVGIVNTGTNLWMSSWNRNEFFSFDYNGTFIDSFKVTGVGTTTSGARSLTFDGTYVYAAANNTSLYKIDPATKTNVATITLPALTGSGSGLTATRWASYDPTADGGNGGFWIGNFDTDILQVSMTGTVLNTIPVGNIGLGGMYGGVFENANGTANLWINNQEDPNGSGATGAFITQIDIASQTPTGVFHDMEPDFGSPGGIGGGISFTTLPGQSQPCIFANDQGVQTTAYELTVTGLKHIDFAGKLSLNPNPAKNGALKINYVPATIQNEVTVRIMDIAGKAVYTETFQNVTELNKSVTLQNAQGIYNVTITNDKGETLSKKLVVN